MSKRKYTSRVSRLNIREIAAQLASNTEELKSLQNIEQVALKEEEKEEEVEEDQESEENEDENQLMPTDSQIAASLARDDLKYIGEGVWYVDELGCEAVVGENSKKVN